VVLELVAPEALPGIRNPVDAAFHSMVAFLFVASALDMNHMVTFRILTAYANVYTCVAPAAIHWKNMILDAVRSTSDWSAITPKRTFLCCGFTANHLEGVLSCSLTLTTILGLFFWLFPLRALVIVEEARLQTSSRRESHLTGLH